MNAALLPRIRRLLLARRDALRRSLALELSLLGRGQNESSEYDEAQEAETDAVFSQLAKSENDELAQIEYALDRMRDGQYGLCDECGEHIPSARLRALPYATTCIRCQRELERRPSGSGPSDDDFGPERRSPER